MTTAVFSAVQYLHSTPVLVCQLSDTSPEAALDRLAKSGVLAIPGPDLNSIVILGFNAELSKVLAFYRSHRRFYGSVAFAVGKLKKACIQNESACHNEPSIVNQSPDSKEAIQ